MVDMLDPEVSEGQELPVGQIRPVILDNILLFMEYHAGNPMADIVTPITTDKMKEIVSEWDAEFIDLEDDVLQEVILGANYLNCNSLLNLSICKMATLIHNKEPEEVKKRFKIPDISPEEEKRVRDENPWVFEIGEV